MHDKIYTFWIMLTLNWTWNNSEKATKLSNGIAVFQGLTNLALNAIIGGTTIGCGYFVGSGDLSGGDLMSFMASAQLLMKNLSSLSQIMTAYVKMGISGDRLGDWFYSKF